MKQKNQQQHSVSISLYESSKAQPTNSSLLNGTLNTTVKRDEQERGSALTQFTLSQSFQNDYLNVPLASGDKQFADPSQFLPNLKKGRVQEMIENDRNENYLSTSNGNISQQETINVKTCSSSVSKQSPDRNYSGKKNQSLGAHNHYNNSSINANGDINQQQGMNFPSLQKENTERQVQIMQKIKSNNSKKGNTFRIKKSAYLFSQNNISSPPQGYLQHTQNQQQQLLMQYQGNSQKEPYSFQQQQQHILQQIQVQQQMLSQISAKVPQQSNLGGSQANSKGSQIIQQLKKSYLNQLNKQSDRPMIKGKFVGEEYGLPNNIQQSTNKTNGLYIDNRNQLIKRSNITIHNNNSLNLQFISVPPSQFDSEKQPSSYSQQLQQTSQYGQFQQQQQQSNTMMTQNQIRSISQNQKTVSMLRNQKSLKDLNEKSVNEFDGFMNTRDFFSTKQQQRENSQQIDDSSNPLNTLDQSKDKPTPLQQHKFLQVISTMNTKSIRNSEKLQQIQVIQSSDRRNTSHSISKASQGSTSNRRASNFKKNTNKNISSSNQNNKLPTHEGIDDCQDDQSIVSGQTTKNEIEDDGQGINSQLKHESDRTYSLINQLKCIELKPLYAKQRQQFHKRVLVIHFETVFLTQSNSYFWESWSSSINSNEGGNNILNYQSISNAISISGNSAQSSISKENYFAKFRNDLKRFMKNICKKYTVILIFQARKRSKDLFHYLLRMNYLFDGAYQMEEQECSSTDINRSPTMAINYNYIISDFYKNKKPTSFTIIDCVSSEFILPNSQVFIDPTTQQSTAFVEKNNMHHFTYKMPKVKISQHKIRVILMKNRQYSPKYPDCTHLVDVINAGERKEVLKNNQIISYVLKMNKIIQTNLSNLTQRKNITSYFSEVDKIKSINKINCRVKNEADSDKKLESFRNLMVEYIKSFKNSDKILHLHSLIGDILVRNRDIFRLYYKESFYSKPYHGTNISQILSTLSKIQTVDTTGSTNQTHQNDPFSSLPDIPSVYDDKSQKEQNLSEQELTHTADLLNLEEQSETTTKECLQNFNLCIYFVLSCEIWKA